MKTIKLSAVSLLLFIGINPFFSLQSSTAEQLLLGVFPYLSTLRMDDIFSPVSHEISQQLKRQVKFRTSSNLPKFKENLNSEYYDLAIIQPILYPVAVDKLGYIPLLRMQEPVFSVIMVLQNSPLKSINDLVGKAIATPPVNGPVVLLAKRSLMKQGISAETDIHFYANKTVGSCLQKVLVRQADACIAPNFAVAPFEKSMGVKFRVLFRSDGVPNRALVVHPRVAEPDREKIRQTMLSWRNSEKGRKLLNSMNTNGFVKIVDSEYDIIRSLMQDMNER